MSTPLLLPKLVGFFFFFACLKQTHIQAHRVYKKEKAQISVTAVITPSLRAEQQDDVDLS